MISKYRDSRAVWVGKYSAKAFKQVVDRLLSVFGNKECRKFIVLSRSRTGSNLLISFLNSHPNIRARGEMFARLNGKNCKDVLARGFARQPFYVKATGFKIFYYHPMDDDSGHVWDVLAELDDLRIIHLKRRNILRTLISRKIADTQGVWKASSPGMCGIESKAVSFTVQELRESLQQTRVWERFGEETFRNHPFISVYYEDLAGDPESTFSKITEFLGVPYVRPKTFLKQQNPERMRDLVKNYEELKSAFQGTEWQEFFKE